MTDVLVVVGWQRRPVPDVVEALNSHGLTPMPSTREELAKTMENECVTWGRIIRERKITVD